jgi:hypothetical protein
MKLAWVPFLVLACRSEPAVDTGASVGTPRETKPQPRVAPEPLDPPGTPSLAPPEVRHVDARRYLRHSVRLQVW